MPRTLDTIDNQIEFSKQEESHFQRQQLAKLALDSICCN